MATHPVTPPEGHRPVLVLVPHVSEHTQALAVVAVVYGGAVLAHVWPVPASVTTLTGTAGGYAWAVLLAGSGLPVLVAAWARAGWLRPVRRLALERGGHYMQAGATLVLAVGASTLGARGALGAIAWGAWALASVVRAIRLGRDARKIAGMMKAQATGDA